MKRIDHSSSTAASAALKRQRTELTTAMQMEEASCSVEEAVEQSPLLSHGPSSTLDAAALRHGHCHNMAMDPKKSGMHTNGHCQPETTNTIHQDNNTTETIDCKQQTVEWFKSYFSLPPISQQESESFVPAINDRLRSIQRNFDANGTGNHYNHMPAPKTTLNSSAGSLQRREETKTHNKRTRAARPKDLQPRSYQTAYLELCKKQNTIVYLGTGRGKTLIAWKLIEHFAGDFKFGKQSVFVVPTRELASQQGRVLREHLMDYSVETVHGQTVRNDEDRAMLTKRNVLVGTHGALLELFSRYKDLFRMERVNVLVLDECHHATGGSDYVQLMSAYHQVPEIHRPRVLGLTASPLINVKPNTPEDVLALRIRELEQTLDARIPSPSELGIDSEVLRRETKITKIPFDRNLDATFEALPRIDNFKVHPCRLAEFGQVEELYQDLGPLVVGLYLDSINLKPNLFEEETMQQFQEANSYLAHVQECCKSQCSKRYSTGGRTDKLMALEEMLAQELSKPGAVGIVFVTKRVTALALNFYFNWRLDAASRPDPELPQTESRRSTADDCLKIVILNDQFADAEDDPTDLLHDVPGQSLTTPPQEGLASCRNQPSINVRTTTVRADVLVQAVGLILNQSVPNGLNSVLDKLRKGTINVLFATSVVEEGVDISACSFVAAFDRIHSIKSFVQMKGRARRQESDFYEFYDVNNDHQGLGSSEDLVNEFLSKRESAEITQMELRHCECTAHLTPAEAELRAVELGYYSTAHCFVSLKDAQSLLHRYLLSVPMDPCARSKRSSMEAYLPAYDETASKLLLPLNIASVVDRKITLPTHHLSMCKTDRKNVLAMMACVRLHRCGQLTDRLLPLTSDSVESKISKVCKDELTPSALLKLKRPVRIPRDCDLTEVEMFVCPMIVESDAFQKYRRILSHHDGSLAFLSKEPVSSVPSLMLSHYIFGDACCSVTPTSIKVRLSREDRDTLSQFFALLVNIRWKKKRSADSFQFSETSSGIDGSEDYIIGCVDSEGNLMLEYMRKALEESKRSKQDRIEAARSWGTSTGTKKPRLWSPVYDDFAIYVSLGPSSLTCGSSFTHKTLLNISTYQQYYEERYGLHLAAECPMFEAQRLWEMPAGMKLCVSEDSCECPMRTKTTVPIRSCHTLLENLPLVHLPRDAVAEASVADVGLMLLTTFLPQHLYHIEKYLRAQSFVDYCYTCMPYLGAVLSKLKLEDVVTVLTAQSCNETTSYELLEWFGDAVLKMVHTDVLVKSVRLKEWISCFHEGLLSVARSVMGSNNRLEMIAKALGIDFFIMTCPLSATTWAPKPLVAGAQKAINSDSATGKTCADVIEALLGLVYLEYGYKCALQVAQELHCTIQWEDLLDHDVIHMPVGEEALRAVKDFTGYEFPPRSKLLKEALTHPTDITSEVPSYQRLEWIGDAVVCLAVRECLYRKFCSSSSAKVGEMVAMESAIVSNQSLALLALKGNLHLHLQHTDVSLPARIREYANHINHRGRGLWGTDPPKALADLTESALGAVHLHGGFELSRKAALHALHPLLLLLTDCDAPHHHVLSYQPLRMLREKFGQLVSFTLEWLPDHNNDEKGNSDVLSQRQCRISCSVLGTEILSLVDVSKAAGKNRAAHLILSAWNEKRNPELCAFLERARLIMARRRQGRNRVKQTKATKRKY